MEIFAFPPNMRKLKGLCTGDHANMGNFFEMIQNHSFKIELRNWLLRSIPEEYSHMKSSIFPTPLVEVRVICCIMKKIRRRNLGEIFKNRRILLRMNKNFRTILNRCSKWRISAEFFPDTKMPIANWMASISSDSGHCTLLQLYCTLPHVGIYYLLRKISQFALKSNFWLKYFVIFKPFTIIKTIQFVWFFGFNRHGS